MLVLELIAEVVGSLVSFVDQLIRLIRICIRIWSIWRGRQPALVGNGHQEDIPLAGNDETEAEAAADVEAEAAADVEADATNRQ